MVLILAMNTYAKESDKTDIRIVAGVAKNGFVDEALVYEVKLFSSSPDISNVRVVKAPSFPKDVKVIQGITKNNRPERIQEKGKTFYCWTILRNFLLPSTPGKFSVGESKYVVFIPHEKVIYHDFWGSSRTVEYEEKLVDCGAIDFKINSLPENKINKEFAGCVGNFKVEGWFPPGNIVKGRESYAVFSISGYGSLKDLKLPNIFKIFSSGCHLKEVEQNEEQMQRDGSLYSEVTLTCKFVPDEEEFSINPLELIFFNPETKKYYTAASETLHWTSHSTKKTLSNSREAIEI